MGEPLPCAPNTAKMAGKVAAETTYLGSKRPWRD